MGDVTHEDRTVADLGATDCPFSDLRSPHRTRRDLSFTHGTPHAIAEVLKQAARALSTGSKGEKGTRSVDSAIHGHSNQPAGIRRGRDREPRTRALLRSPAHSGIDGGVDPPTFLDRSQMGSVG